MLEIFRAGASISTLIGAVVLVWAIFNAIKITDQVIKAMAEMRSAMAAYEEIAMMKWVVPCLKCSAITPHTFSLADTKKSPLKCEQCGYQRTY